MNQRPIALFVPTLQCGGAERVIVTLANNLSAQGYRIHLLALDVNGPLRSEIEQQVEIINITGSRALFCIPSLILYLKRNKPEVLLSTMNHLNIIVTFSCMLAKFSGRLFLREANYLSLNLVRTPLWKRILTKIIVPFFYNRATTIISPSNGIKEDLIRNFNINPALIKVIYNPIDIDLVERKAIEQVEHSWFRLDRNFKTLIFVGSLSSKKDPLLLLEAFMKINHQVPVKLVFIGEGPLRGEIEQKILKYNLGETVQTIGQVKNPFKYMKQADLLCLSSVQEGLPNVLIQALALGLPCISTNCKSGPNEILENGKYGALVDYHDLNHYASKLEYILNNLNQWSKFSLKERGGFFSIRNIIPQYISAMSLEEEQSNGI